MSDWMDDLGSLEDKLEKIKKIAEQEKAMQAVLPLRFSANMQAYVRLIPAIFNKFKDRYDNNKIEYVEEDLRNKVKNQVNKAFGFTNIIFLLFFPV